MKNQFETIQPWLSLVLGAIKREIRTEHLANSSVFAKNHFGNRPLNRLTAEEIFQAYEKELLKGEDEELKEWVVNRWVFKHGDLYQHFADRLEAIDANYDSLESLTEEQSEQVLLGAKERFGALSTYLFSVLNRVVFPQSIFDQLRSVAQQEQTLEKEQQEKAQELQTIEQLKSRYEKETARLQEKMDSKIAGIMKKYSTDIEALKKQIRALQHQLNSR